MKRGLIVVSALAAVCSIGLTTALAYGPGCCKSKDGAKVAAKSGDSCTRTCGSSDEFPAMSMMVGTKSYDCCMSAEAVAKKMGTKVMYVVGEEKFECRDKATMALADSSERFTRRFTSIACVADGKVMYCSDSSGCTAAKSVSTCNKSGATMAKAEGKTCPLTGKTMMAKSDGAGCCKSKGGAVAMTKEQIEACCKNAKEVKYMTCGRTFKSREEAVKARDDVMKAVSNIRMTYLVDGKSVDCSSKVCPKAKAAGKVHYVVQKNEMDCEAAARVALARAQFDAARSFAEKLAKI